MGRGRPRKQGLAVRMEDGVETWERLRQWGAAAELLYAPHSPIRQPPTPGEPHAFLVARRIATLMARLNELCRQEAGVLLTPRDALLELADILRFGLISFHREVVMGQLHPEETVALLAEYVAHRTAPQSGVVEALHVITWVSVKLRVEMFVEQLRTRIRRELESSDMIKRTPQQVVALRTTLTLLNDFESFYDNTLVTFPCVQLMDSVPEVAEQLMPILLKQYYQLSEWVELTETSTSLKPITETKVQSLDRENSTIVLHRTDVTSPWGLIFNECGKVVDIDVSLRTASVEGEELHRLLRCTTDGAAVISVNSTIFPKLLPDGVSEVIEIFKNTTISNKRIVVKLAADSLNQSNVQQLAFFLPNQGGEGSSGQRATLVLHRPDRRMPWNCNITDDLMITEVPRRRLSADAKNFFSEYTGRVGLMAVNGVEVTSVTQACALCAETETIVLNLLVVTPAMAAQRQKEAAMRKVTSVELSREQIEASREIPLVPETETSKNTKKMSKTGKQNKKELLLNAEDIDASTDATYTVDANEAEELTIEPQRLAEEEDVKETFPYDADEEGAVNSSKKQEELEFSNLENVNSTNSVLVDEPSPLVMPNDVTIELLTPEEMVIRRNSTDIKWGISLEKTIDDGAKEAIRMIGLPLLSTKNDARRRHPFYKTFKKPPVKTDWRIQSVNGISVSKGPEFLEIMRRALKMRIKFFR